MSSQARKYKKSITNYRDLVLSEQDIAVYEIPYENLFELTIENEVIGLVYDEDLKDFLDHNEIEGNATLKKFDDEEEYPVYEHPYFQRRDIQEVGKCLDENPFDEYYLLIEGKKEGPFSSDDIRNMLENKELLYTDTASSDGGTQWHKVYDIKIFDRRYNTEKDLPNLPSQSIFKHDKINSSKEIGENSNDAVVRLAMMGNQNNDNDAQNQKKNQIEQEIDEVKKEERTKAIFNYILLIIGIASITGMILYFYQLGNEAGKANQQENQAEKLLRKKVIKRNTRTKPTARKAKVINKTESNRDLYEQDEIDEPREVRKKVRSRKRRKAKRKIETSPREEEINVIEDEGAYYDDNDAPVEAEEIRESEYDERIRSKNTKLNSAEEYVDENEEDEEFREDFEEDAEFNNY